MKKQVMVQVQAEHLDRLDDVSGDLRDAGMTIEGVLSRIGAIRGVVDESKLHDLKRVAGVADATVVGDAGQEEPRDYRIS